LIHRDIKPENILIKGVDVGGIAVISDFGTVRKKASYETSYISMQGTKYYFAPETIYKRFDAKVDIWAMGIVLYEMLTNREYPFEIDF